MQKDEYCDERVPIEPDWLSFHELPDSPEGWSAIYKKQRDQWTGKVATVRVTYFNDEFPSDIYPHGVYFEGWTIDPAYMTPLGKQAPFNYPLTRALAGGE